MPTSVSSGVELTYDYYHRLIAQKDYATSNKYLQRTFSYTNGNVSQVSYTSDMGSIGTEQYTYTNGTLTKISFASQDVWELDAENSLGQITSVSSGLLTRTTAYASNGLLTGITFANGNSTLQNFGYSFDGTKGNLTWRKDVDRNLQENFSYDGMNRLIYNGNGYTTYDDKGNITYQGESYTTMQYNDTNKPYAVTGMSSTQSLLPTATQSVTYNVQGRPLSIAESTRFVEEPVNKGEGKRMKRSEQGSEILNNLVNIFIRHIGYLFLIVNGKEVDTCIECFNNHVQRNDPKPTSFTPAFALNAETNLAFSTSKRDSCLRILHQFILQGIDVISKGSIAFCQTLGLATEFFSIVKSYQQLCFCSKFFDQCIKRFESLTCKSTFSGFMETFCDSFSYKGFLCLNICRGSNHSVNGYAFNCPKYLLQTCDKACILNIQYYLCHNSYMFDSACKDTK